MGAWGATIFQDDRACDVRDQYTELLSLGWDEKRISKELETVFLADAEKHDEATYWLALALTRHRFGRLDEATRKKAIDYVDSGKALKYWEALAEGASSKGRQKELLKAKETLLSAQPKPKNIKPSADLLARIDQKFTTYPWKKGQLYAYQCSDKKYVVLACVAVQEIELNGFYQSKGDSYEKAKLPTLWEPTLLLLDYREAKPPTQAEAKKLKPLMFKPSADDKAAFEDHIELTLSIVQETLAETFAQFHKARASFFEGKSEAEFKEMYSARKKLAEKQLKKYSDKASIMQQLCYKPYTPDARLVPPADRITPLDVTQEYEHGCYFYGKSWEQMEASIALWTKSESPKSQKISPLG